METPPKTLIVDDDPEFLRALSSLLSSAGFQAITAADVRSAEPILNRDQPDIDLLIMDLALPGKITGFDVISAVTRRPRAFKIIAASAVYPKSVLEYISRHMGADAYVAKARPGEPFNAEEWIQTVRRLLGGKTMAADPE